MLYRPQVKSVCVPMLKSQSGPPAVFQDLSAPHGWPIKKVMVDLPVRLKGNSKHTASNLLSLLGA